VHPGETTSALRPRAGGHALVLEQDAALAEAIPPGRRALGTAASMASTVRLSPGSWDARHDARLGRDGFGLLVLDGVLLRGLGVDGRFGAELLGPGDLLRPWQHDGVHIDLPLTHEIVSHLAAARRASVSTVLAKLARAGSIRREGRGWVICGDPPSLSTRSDPHPG